MAACCVTVSVIMIGKLTVSVTVARDTDTDISTIVDTDAAF